MQIAERCVALFHYTLTNDQGEVIDSSDGREPLAYLHGAGNIVQGLEQEMTGKQAGDKFNVVVPPELGYGVHNDALAA
jgi:FKBP-type peptidyl-prolyl cis-trans isomerase SlyD